MCLSPFPGINYIHDIERGKLAINIDKVPTTDYFIAGLKYKNIWAIVVRKREVTGATYFKYIISLYRLIRFRTII